MSGRYEQLKRSITNHTPSTEQVAEIEALREMAKSLGYVICEGQPPSREQSLALTHLEEVVMWGVKGIILNGTS